MELAVDAESAFGVDLLGISQEGVIDDRLRDVALHVGRGSLLSLGVDQVLDHFQRRWVGKAFLAGSVRAAIVAACGATLLSSDR